MRRLPKLAAVAIVLAVTVWFAGASAWATPGTGGETTSLDPLYGTLGTASSLNAVALGTGKAAGYTEAVKATSRPPDARYLVASAPVGSELGGVFTRATAGGTVPGVAPLRTPIQTECNSARASSQSRSASTVVNPVSTSPIIAWWLAGGQNGCVDKAEHAATGTANGHAATGTANGHAATGTTNGHAASRARSTSSSSLNELPRVSRWVDTELFPVRSYVLGHVYATTDPLGSGREVAAFAIDDEDRPYAGSQPRGDLMTGDPTHGPTQGDYYKPGSTSYTSVPVLIPTGLPLTGIDGNWFQWAQSESIAADQWAWSLELTSFTDRAANHYALASWYYNKSAPAWIGPKVDGRWHTAILQVHYATDDTGWIRLWWDGVPQTFQYGPSAGTKTMSNIPTLLPPDGSKGWPLDIDSYRNHGSMPGTVTIYHGAPAIGPTYESVADTLSAPTGP